MSQVAYSETFENGPGGWYGWISNFGGPKQLELGDGTVTSRSPWWIDYNHAPPGAGYLHMLASLSTSGPQTEAIRETGGRNRFIADAYPLDFMDAVMTVRLKGELRGRGAEVLLLVQGVVDGICSGWLLSGQPIRVTPDWSEETVTLAPDPAQWTALGSRHDRTDMYGVKPLERVLADVNTNIMLVLFPLTVTPMGPIAGDPHLLRPERDYAAGRSELPEGYITVAAVRIRFADGT